MNPNAKFYHWTFELYKESISQDYQKILAKTGLSIAYIWHDQDTHTQEDFEDAIKAYERGQKPLPAWTAGDLKKEHAHVLVKFNNQVRLGYVLQTFRELGINYAEPVRNFVGMCRYLVHADNPEKAQYDRKDIVTLNGFKLKFGDEKEQAETYRNEAIDFIIEHDITEFRDFMGYVRNERPEWTTVICKNIFTIKTLIDSIRHSKGQRLTEQVAEAELKRREEAQKQLIAAAAEADLGSLGDYYQDDSPTHTDETDDEISERIFMTFVIDYQVHQFEDLAGAAASIYQKDKPGTKRFQNFIREFIITQPETYLIDLIKKAWQL